MGAGPLSVAAIRNHPITASPIGIESELESRDGCRVFDVSYRSDGYKVFALLTQPSTPTPSDGFPVIILAHGYIAPAEYQTTGTDYQGFTNAYCQAGYTVIKPDFRGHGRSEGTATGGHFSPDYAYDVLNLIASLGSFASINPNRVALMGHSMGAHVVLRCLVADHGLPIKASILASGVVGSLEDIIYNWPENEIPADVIPLRQRILNAIGTPQQNPGFWHDGSAINYVSAITAPIEIDHGEADAVVPLAFSQHLDTALTTAHKTHDFHVYPGGDHQFTNPAIRSAFLENSLAFLHAHL